ncbi:hypothetical protein GCM10011588_61650 [Nocardia jinanensis]|uniref:DUF1707 domain-containing protein n=1 Tax=Nocardia jinanensis TaxID=382504 RepID=A0A917VYK0_9NOCA|nr:hypothetical protein GCM10011588_61650 [Nocardia jinanensis]
MNGPDPVYDGTGSGGQVVNRDLRVSDAEREHVGQLLQRAVGLGMLSLGEFTERMDTALASRTRGELNSVLVDLPGVRLIGEPATERAAGHGKPVPLPQPGHAAASGLAGVVQGGAIRPRMSGVNRRGNWQVAPMLRVNSWLSGVTLDFTQAIMTTQVVEIQVDDYASSLTLVVPQEATVDLDGLELVGSSVNNKVRSGPPIGPLHLLVHGRVRFGSVTAKQPFMAHWRRLLGQ